MSQFIATAEARRQALHAGRQMAVFLANRPWFRSLAERGAVMSAADEMEAMRLDVMTGRDRVKTEAAKVHLDGCAHCGEPGDMRFLCQRPYVGCKECGATTATAETIEEAAAKWNRRP